PGHGLAVRPGDRHAGPGHRRQGRRLHGQGLRRLRDRADGQPRAHHAPRRGVPGCGLAPAGLAPPAEGAAHEMGVCAMSRGATGPGARARAVFLDRDGVLNRAIVRDGRPYPPETLEAFELLPGVPEAVRKLHDAGFLTIVVTNQPDVARGTQRREVVEA